MSFAQQFIEDPRWDEKVGTDPVKLARARDTLFQAYVQEDPERFAFYSGQGPEQQAELREEFDQRLNQEQGEVFSVETGSEMVRERRLVPGPRVPFVPPREEVVNVRRTLRRPVYDEGTELFLREWGEDPSVFEWGRASQQELEGATSLLLQAYPDRKDEILANARERARNLLAERGALLFPEAEDEESPAKVFGQEATRRFLDFAGAAGGAPFTDLVQRIVEDPGLLGPGPGALGRRDRREAAEAMNRLSAMSEENRRLSSLAYGDDTTLLKAAGTGMAWMGGANAVFRRSIGMRRVPLTDPQTGAQVIDPATGGRVMQAAGFRVDPLSRRGLAEGIGIDAAVGAAFGPEYAPSVIAQALGIEPGRLTAAAESASFGLAAGTILRQLSNAAILRRVRKMPQFADLADLPNRDFMRAASDRMQDMWEQARRRAAQDAQARPGPRETESMGVEFMGDVADAARRPAPELPGRPGAAAPVARAADEAPGISVRPGDEFQVTVQHVQEGVPGFVQVDHIRGGDSIESGSLNKFRQGGVDVPEVPDWVPQGRYSLEELRERIRQGPPWRPAAAGVTDAPEPAATQSMIDPEQVPVREIPLDRLRLSEDVPNFKEDAGADGTVASDRLEGTYQRLGTAPIVAWERLGGELEVITGRHRLELARRTGERTIPGQIVRERDGFTQQDALTFDAESNIRDGHGQIRDYGHYFRHAPIGREAAAERGLLSRAKGEAGWHLGRSAEDSLYTLYRNRGISEPKAIAIARGAPNHAGAQDYLIRQAKAKTADELELLGRNLIRMQPGAMEPGRQMDLFGADDSWVQAAEKIAAEQRRMIQQNKDRILAVRGAARRPEQAREMGVDIRDPEAVGAEMRRLEELNARIAQPDAEMLAELRQRAGLPVEDVEPPAAVAPVAEPAAPVRPATEDAPGQLSMFGDEAAPSQAVGAKPVTVAEIDGAINERARTNLFVEKGQYHLPGIRFQDAETAGRTAYVVEKGEASITDWNRYVESVRRENRLTDESAPVRPPDVAEAPTTDQIFTATTKRQPQRGFVGDFRLGDRIEGAIYRTAPDELRIYQVDGRGNITAESKAFSDGDFRKIGTLNVSATQRVNEFEFSESGLSRLRKEPAIAEQADAPVGETRPMFGEEEMPFNLTGDELPDPEAALRAEQARRAAEQRQGTLFDRPGAPGGGARASAGDVPGAEGRPAQPRDPAEPPPDDQVPLYVMEMPEMVQLARALLDGRYPRVLERLRIHRGQALGVFRGETGGPGAIELRADIFNLVQPDEKAALLARAQEYGEAQLKAGAIRSEQLESLVDERYVQTLEDLTQERMRQNPEQAMKTLAHEIGHLVDHLPDHLIQGRGNVLGRLATLKGFLSHTIDIEPLAVRLRRQAEEIVGPRAADEAADAWRARVDDQYRTLINNVADGDELPTIAGEPSLMLTPKVRRELRKRAEKQVGPRPPKDEEADLAAWRQEVSRIYRELVEVEIGDRNLATVQEVRNELLSLTEWWTGDVGQPGTPYHRYRTSGVELYAEAFSVLVNNPAELARRAPTFYEMFFNYLGRKPEVKRVYEQLQDDVRSGRIYRDRVRNLRESFSRANERGLAASDIARTHTIGELGDWFSFFFDRTFGPVIRRSGKDPDLARRDRLIEAIEDFKYHQTQVELFLRQVKFKALHPLEEAGLEWMDLSEYMFHLRVANERTNIANPLGWTPKQSLERLAEIERALGPEKWGSLQQAQQGFRQAYENEVLRVMRESQALSPELMDFLDENVFYSTFHASRELASTDPRTIEGALNERFGKGVTSGIYRQIGNLGEIEDPLTATMVKAMSLIRMAYRSRAARETADLLANIGDPMFRPADFRWSQRGGRGFREPVEVKTSRVGTLTYLHKGKVQAFYVPRQISEAFDGGDFLGGALFNSIFQATHAVKGFFTAFNPGFWAWSLYWDSWGWINRMPGARAAFGPRAYLKYFPKAARAAIDLARGRPNPLADEALRNHDVISRAYYRGERVLADTRAERILIQYGLQPPNYDESSISRLRTFWTKAFLTFTAPGQIQERIPKIAGRMYLEDHFSETSEWVREKRIAAMRPGEKKQTIHQMAGSPDYLSKGKLAVWLDTFGRLFFNPMKEGIRSKVRQIKERPVESAMKFLAYTAPPTIILWMIENGHLNEALTELLGESDANELELMMRSIPEREKTNHHVVPLGWHDREQMKVLYLRLPLDPNEKALNASLRAALTQGEGGEGIIQYFGEAMPGDNPYLQVGRAWWDYYVRGINPYDSFYRRNVLTDDEVEARQGTVPLMKWTSNQFMGTLVGRFEERDRLVEPDPEGLERFLRAPGIQPTIGRWLRISNRGLYDEANLATEQIREHRATVRMAGWEMLRKVIDEEPWSQKETELFAREPYMTEWLSRKLPEVMTMREMDPEMRTAYQAADSIEERIAILQRFAERRER